MDLKQLFNLSPDDIDRMDEGTLLTAKETLTAYIEKSRPLLAAIGEHKRLAMNLHKLNAENLEFAKNAAQTVEKELNELAAGDQHLEAFIDNVNDQVNKMRSSKDEIDLSPAIAELKELHTFIDGIDAELKMTLKQKRDEFAALEHRKAELQLLIADKKRQKAEEAKRIEIERIERERIEMERLHKEELAKIEHERVEMERQKTEAEIKKIEERQKAEAKAAKEKKRKESEEKKRLEAEAAKEKKRKKAEEKKRLEAERLQRQQMEEQKRKAQQDHFAMDDTVEYDPSEDSEF